MTEVLVVGAGPVGLTMAAELARYGVDVRIVDKAARRSDKSKALVLWSRTLELLDRAGCSAAFVAAGHQVDAANIITGSKVIARVGFSEVNSDYRFALMLPQSETERLLEAHLASLGVRVERETELAGFTAKADGVTARLCHRDRPEETVAAAWLLGCDGAHSAVRHGLGLAFEGDTLRSDWLLADVHLAGLRVPDTELANFWHADGVLAMFPISPGRYRIIADHGRSTEAPLAEPTLAEVQQVVDRRGPGGLVLSDPIWLSAFRINERKVADYRAGRAFVAGDAAHVHSPAGGQGMNTGMQDAINLAWKLAMVCHGHAPDALLDSYSVERSAIGAQVLAQAGRLTAIAVLKNHAAQAVRNVVGGLVLGLAPVRRAMADTLSEVSVGYAHSPLNGPGARGLDGPGPGERLPPVRGQTPVGAGATPRFALFAAAGEAVAALLHSHAEVLEPAARPPLAAGGVWLVRPDGYVAAAVKDDDIAAISAYLAEHTGAHAI